MQLASYNEIHPKVEISNNNTRKIGNKLIYQDIKIYLLDALC